MDRVAKRAFILPPTIAVIVLLIFPLVFSLLMTFTDFRLGGGLQFNFTGFQNWQRLFEDSNFHTVLRNTVVFVCGGVALQYSLGFGLALLLNQDIKFRRFFRISLLLPMMVSPVAVSYVIGKMIFSESFGPINDVLFNLGLPVMRWTLSPGLSMLIIILVDTWQWTPLFILILLAALQSIPNELYEAARVDGARSWHLFRHITFPLLMPISASAIVIRALEAFKVIDVVRVVTGGGPGNSTEVVTLFAYDVGLKGGDLSYASTIAFSLLITTILFSLIFLSIARRLTPDM